ncbi:hypothetical protein ABPG75_011980 [Micractinium tetrahymenae]
MPPGPPPQHAAAAANATPARCGLRVRSAALLAGLSATPRKHLRCASPPGTLPHQQEAPSHGYPSRIPFELVTPPVMAPAQALLVCLAIAAALASPASAADFVNFTDPITALANDLTVGTTGQPVGGRQGPSDPTIASYQKFANGIIVYQLNHGTHCIYPAAVASLWEANKASLGNPERDSVSFPGAAASCAKSKGLSGWVTYFTGGGIVYTVGWPAGPAPFLAQLHRLWAELRTVCRLSTCQPVQRRLAYTTCLPAGSVGCLSAVCRCPHPLPPCCERQAELSHSLAALSCLLVCRPPLQTNTKTAVMITGPTYVKYLQMGDAFGALGPPQSRAFKGTGMFGPLATGFACGFIVEAFASSPYRPAYAMLDDSPITKAHQAGAYASMGVPIGDQDSVKKGLTSVGLSQRYSGGVMYYSSTTGAQALRAKYPDVTGRNGFLRDQADPKCPKLGVSKCNVIYVADPNNPYDCGESDPDPDHLVVHPSSGRWYYTDKYNNLAPKRYALMNIPFSWVATKGPAIVDDIPWGTVWDIAMLYIFGDAELEGTNPNGNAIGSKDCLITPLPKPADATRPIIFLGPTTPRLYMVRRFQGDSQRGGGFTFRIKPSGNYSFGIKTTDGAFMLDAPKGDGSVDVVSVGGFGTSPASQAVGTTPGSAKSINLCLTAPTRSVTEGPPLVYMLSKLGASAGERISSALLNGGEALKIGSSIAGRQLQYDLRISRGIDEAGLQSAQTYVNFRPGAGQQLLVPKLLPQLVVQPGRKRSRRRAE